MKTAIFATGHEYNSVFKLGDHQFCDAFVKNGYQVLWLQPPYNILMFLQDREKYDKRTRVHQQRPIEVAKNVFEYAPYTLMPYGNKKPFDSFWIGQKSLHFCTPSIKNFLSQSIFSHCDVLWVSNPKYAFLHQFIEYDCLIHRMGDDFKNFERLPKSVSSMEEYLIKKANLFYVTSRQLYDRYKHFSTSTYYLANGVAYDQFIKTEYIYPEEYKGYEQSKKIIYVGAIDTWFDSELLEFSALQNPHLMFFIIGPCKIDIDNLERLNNVHFLGPKGYNQIPDYIYHADIGIIPFKINDLTNSVCPIKMFEYSAMGVPTLSTSMKEVNYLISKNKNLSIYTVRDKEEFSKILNRIKKKEPCIETLKQFAASNTWESRGNKIMSDINSFLEEDKCMK